MVEPRYTPAWRRAYWLLFALHRSRYLTNCAMPSDGGQVGDSSHMALLSSPWRWLGRPTNLWDYVSQGMLTQPKSLLQLTPEPSCVYVVPMWRIAWAMGIAKQNLIPPALPVSVADNMGLKSVEASFVALKEADGATTTQMVYFADKVNKLFISKQSVESWESSVLTSLQSACQHQQLQVA